MINKLGGFSGLFLGLAAIFGAFFLEGGSAKTLFLTAPLLIVFGGTFAATIIGFGWDKFSRILELSRMAYFPRNYDLKKLILTFVDLSIVGRQEGFLALEKQLDEMEYNFPKKMIRFLLDGHDSEALENIAYTEINAMQDRHFSNISLFSKMGGYAPTMGIIGTVMGLIMTLANVGADPNELIRNIATAFIATLWGILSANLIWLPIADRLKQCHIEEKYMMEITLEGVLVLQSGEIPSIIKMRLISMLSQRDQEELIKR
ncbi:MAG: MotA/TolQ/ExbB proton channel family protein [Melioribacteraceae bacterium]|nr:MotA/TolQ/ExbB proton channel family protein [Melioribacteraceae bacterium]